MCNQRLILEVSYDNFDLEIDACEDCRIDLLGITIVTLIEHFYELKALQEDKSSRSHLSLVPDT
jgi:hypothetical protein